MLYHYYFRNNDQLSLEQCATMSEVEICQRSIISLYARRVKEWDQDLQIIKCDSILEKIQHGEQLFVEEDFADDVIERKMSLKIFGTATSTISWFGPPSGGNMSISCVRA